MKTLLIAIVAIALFTTGCDGKHNHGDHEGSERLVNMKPMVLDYLGPESAESKPALLDGQFYLIDFSHQVGDENGSTETDFVSGEVTFRWLGDIEELIEGETPGQGFKYNGITDMEVKRVGDPEDGQGNTLPFVNIWNTKMRATNHDYTDINGIWSSRDKQYGRFVFYDNDRIEYQISHNWYSYDEEIKDGRKFLTRMLFLRKPIPDLFIRNPIEPEATAPLNNG